MNLILMEAIVDCAAFLALSSDDVIQQDAAVAQLEQMGATLSKLNQEFRHAFATYVNDLARQERELGKDNARIAFFEALPENLGIV